MSDASITQEQVDGIRQMAEEITAGNAPALTHVQLIDALSPEVVRQLCNGWIAWATYQ